MTASKPSPETTLVVILGASAFPKAPSFTSSEAFQRSAEGLRDYLIASDGLGLPRENLLDLFDSPQPASALDEEVVKFLLLRASQLKEENTAARDVLVYYVGHGGFSTDGAEYFLAIRDTRDGNEYYTSYPIKALARTLKEQGRHLRRYLVLDSCFSAAAYEAFQSAPLEVARRQTLAEFPERGTALLCASGPKVPAKAPPNQPHTMFSGALLDTLNNGSPEEPEWLSLTNIGEMIRFRIRELYLDDGVRPEVLSPDQRQGDVSSLPLFPNAALREKRMPAWFHRFEADIAIIRETQAKHDSNHVELEGRFQGVEDRLRILKEGITAAETAAGETNTQQMGRLGRYGLTRTEWDSIPLYVKVDIHDYLRSRLVHQIWSAICVLVCALSWLSLLQFNIGDVWSPIFDMAFVACGLMALISSMSVIYSSIAGAGWVRVSQPEPELTDGEALWKSHDIVVRAQRFDRVHLIPGFEISRSVLAISSIAYVVTFVCAVSIRLGILRFLP
jgi:hypothetical protein